MPRAERRWETREWGPPSAAPLEGDNVMDLLVVLAAAIVALATLGATAAQLGTDSRDGFAAR
jgi:hypothetical protein